MHGTLRLPRGRLMVQKFLERMQGICATPNNVVDCFNGTLHPDNVINKEVLAS